MLYPCIEQLVTDKSCQCRYSLVIAVAKRARQIAEMKAIWNSFSENEKPEWLTWEMIERYEEEMVN